MDVPFLLFVFGVKATNADLGANLPTSKSQTILFENEKKFDKSKP